MWYCGYDKETGDYIRKKSAEKKAEQALLKN
jgi:hypothetical protein